MFLFVTVLVDMVGYGLVVPLLPFYTRQQAAGAALVGLLGSLYAAMQFVGGPFLGGLSDRVGRRPVLIFCLLGASFAYLLLGLAETLDARIENENLDGLVEAVEVRETLERLQALSLEVSETLDAYQDRHAR